MPVKPPTKYRRYKWERALDMRKRVMALAYRQGVITCADVRAIARTHRPDNFLHTLAVAGLLERTGRNRWRPVQLVGRPKVSARQRAAIRAAYIDRGVPQTKLARQYGVTRSLISHLINNLPEQK